LAIASSTSYGLRTKIELVDKYCKNWNLECNLDKSKVTVFKKGKKIKGSGEMEDGWAEHCGCRQI
jgi:hypothetical protein